MKKYMTLCITVMFTIICTVGCGSNSIDDIQNNNEEWSVRYIMTTDTMSTGTVHAVRTDLSVNIYKDMSETDFLNILDYYEGCYNSSYNNNNTYLGERDSDYTCYAVFYKGDSDEVITKIKYKNHEKVPITAEDESYFPKPDWRTSEGEV